MWKLRKSLNDLVLDLRSSKEELAVKHWSQSSPDRGVSTHSLRRGSEHVKFKKQKGRLVTVQ